MRMIERVARALCEEAGRNPDQTVFDAAGKEVALWCTYEPQALAAMAAMREPTPAAIETIASLLTTYRMLVRDEMRSGVFARHTEKDEEWRKQIAETLWSEGIIAAALDKTGQGAPT